MTYSQGSPTSSGYWSSQSSTRTTTRRRLNPHYLCYWLDSCNGQHELDQCYYWEEELCGKKGIYYSPSGDYKLFTQDGMTGVNLRNNRTGCTRVHLLIFNEDRKEILFGLKLCKDNKSDRQKRLQLTFPSAEPYQRNGNMLQIPPRAFQWLTTDTGFANQCLEQGLKNHFLFHNANVIYSVHLTNEQASKLTRNFVQNEEFRSLHWFSLSEIRSKLPACPNYIKDEETESELAQLQENEPKGIKLGEYELWHVIAMCLMYIREHVPGRFDTFLNL